MLTLKTTACKHVPAEAGLVAPEVALVVVGAMHVPPWLQVTCNHRAIRHSQVTKCLSVHGSAQCNDCSAVHLSQTVLHLIPYCD